MPSAAIDQQLHYAYFPARAEQRDSPIVMLNSLGTTTAIWEPLLPVLTELHSVVCVDYAGHGRSNSLSLPTDLETLQNQILGVLDSLGIERAHFVGASVGGMLSMALAASNPERVQSISIVGSSPHMETSMWIARQEAVRNLGVAGITPDVLPRWFTNEFRETNPELVETYRAMLCSTTDNGYRAFCELLAGLDVRPQLSSIQCPTLVVAGEKDTATTVEQAQEIIALVPGSRLEVIPAVAHMIQAMSPDRLGVLLRDHILDSG